MIKYKIKLSHVINQASKMTGLPQTPLFELFKSSVMRKADHRRFISLPASFIPAAPHQAEGTNEVPLAQKKTFRRNPSYHLQHPCVETVFPFNSNSVALYV